jgi:hypothetical protein
MRKKRKPVSFDTVVKFFMQQYSIPTRKDVEKILDRLDRLESLIKSTTGAPKGKRGVRNDAAKTKIASRKPAMTASDIVLDYLKNSRNGASFADIRSETGFEDKKLRNIIFRLHKLKKIKRLNRGSYTAA